MLKVGFKGEAVCVANHKYEGVLTEGKAYQVEVVEGYLVERPYAKFRGDNGRPYQAHSLRFKSTEV
jgi:hypothetical protein